MSSYLKISKNKLNTRILRNFKKIQNTHTLSMLTCYDYQTARMLNETDLDLILVGDSLGNVVLGLDTTVGVTVEMMTIFSRGVKKGAPKKFVIVDMPFGSYSIFEKGIENAIQIFQQAEVEAVKLEGANPETIKTIVRLTEIGIPVMGHIGLTPQSVHELGGYFIHGKDQDSAKSLLNQALDLQRAGVFSIVLECVSAQVAKEITNELSIPTIGIGSGNDTDGQVLVINDLLKMGPESPPKFCTPIANLYEIKKNLIDSYLKSFKKN